MFRKSLEFFLSKIKLLEHALFLISSFVIVLIVMFFFAGDLDIIPLLVIFSALVVLLSRFSFFQKIKKPLIVVVSIFAILLRFCPIIFNFTYYCENNNSDTGVHYYGAQELAKGNPSGFIFGYEKQFPFLIPYTVSLSIFAKFLPINYAIVALNFLSDSIGLVFALLFAKQHAFLNRKKIVFLWIINPISIVMCWLPLNIVLINSLVMIIIYLMSLALSSLKYNNPKKRMLLFALFGLLITIFNLFRPLFSVFLIAASITLLFQIRKKSSFKRIVFCALTMCFLFLISSAGVHAIIEHYLKTPVYHSTGGWSFYLGSNYKTNGTWSPEDRDYYYNELLPEKGTILEANKAAMQLGLRRYKEMGLRIPLHFANKASVLFSDIKNSVYDISYSLRFESTGAKMKIIHSAISLYFIAVFILTLATLNRAIHSTPKPSGIILFVILSIAGLTAASLLVEVMNRYFTIFIPFFLVLASMNSAKNKPAPFSNLSKITKK